MTIAVIFHTHGDETENNNPENYENFNHTILQVYIKLD